MPHVLRRSLRTRREKSLVRLTDLFLVETRETQRRILRRQLRRVLILAADVIAFFVWRECRRLNWRFSCPADALWSLLRLLAEQIFEEAFHSARPSATSIVIARCGRRNNAQARIRSAAS